MIFPPPLPQNQHKAVKKKAVIQRLIIGFRLHEAPHTDGIIGENEPKRFNPQLLGVLGVSHFDLRVDFASLNQPLFRGGYRGKCLRSSPNRSDREGGRGLSLGGSSSVPKPATFGGGRGGGGISGEVFPLFTQPIRSGGWAGSLLGAKLKRRMTRLEIT